MVMVLQVYLPCYYGNEVSYASEKIATSLFHSDWINSNKKYKAAMTIFAENSKKPIKINGFGRVNIDFEMFTTIFNSAYSLFALFQNMK